MRRYLKLIFIEYKNFRFAERQKKFLILFFSITFYIYFAFAPLPNPNIKHTTICVFKNITGYPCGACGTTRALKYIFHGEFFNALLLNPLSYIALTLSLFANIIIIKDLVQDKDILNELLKKKIHSVLLVIIILFTAINWYWNITKNL